MATPENSNADEELEQVQRDIDDARRQAQEDGTLPPDHPERTFIDPDGDGEPDAPGVLGPGV
jgi:hypothetical protein